MFAIAALLASLAFAPPTFVHLTGDSTCPSIDEVARSVSDLAPDLTVAATPARDALNARITDDADAYAIEFAKDRRALSDPARRCDERAASLAVLIALQARPPVVPELPAAPAVSAATPAAITHAAPRWDLELLTVGDVASMPSDWT